MTPNIHELNHFYHAIQSFMDFYRAESAHICLKYDNKVIVDLCCKSEDDKYGSYRNSGLDYRIDQFLELENIQTIFPDFIFVVVHKHQTFEDFLQMTRQKMTVIKKPPNLEKLSKQKEYA